MARKRYAEKGLALCLGVLALGLPALAAAPDPFEAWKAAHPNMEARLADLKAKTAAMIAAAPSFSPSSIAAPPVIWRPSGAPAELWDDADAPRMVIVPAGEYTMGSPDNEPGRKASEGPLHRVRIAYPLAISQYPVTVGEYAKFVAATGYRSEQQCQTFRTDKYENVVGCIWSNPGFDQTPNDPVITVSWGDAQAYVAWLSKKTGHVYRLLTESEYEYADRGGTTTAYWWGEDPAAVCANADGADLDAKAIPKFSEWTVSDCHDGHAFTAPVGSYKANPFGLFDMNGNAWSWVQDCWKDTYDGAPVDGSPVTAPHCTEPDKRGGAWSDTAQTLRSAMRGWNLIGVWHTDNGFRVARVL